MKTPACFKFSASHPRRARGPAFTLIELLVVMAIILVLAGLIIPVVGAVNHHKIRSRANAELQQVVLAIQAYKERVGTYPPDNGGLYFTNSLFYELVGTTTNVENGVVLYRPLDGSPPIRAIDVPVVFTADGFMNCTRGAGGDEGQQARNFYPGRRVGQHLTVTNLSVQWIALGTFLQGPYTVANRLSPWGYNCSSPTNNPATFDLWVDVFVGGKTNRISNWSANPQVVGKPYPYL